jgi:hypothetical protein
MPRIRTISPEFWSDEKVMSVSWPARLLFLGIWGFADFKGDLCKSLMELQAMIFPGDNDTKMEEWFVELTMVGLVHLAGVRKINISRKLRMLVVI